MATRILLGTLCALFMQASGLAAPALFDFNDNDAVATPPGNPAPSPTQAGWTGITQTGLNGVSTSFGTLNVSFVPIIGAATPVLDDRDRGQLSGGAHPLSNMLRDIFTITGNPNTTGNGTVDIVVSGMNAGNYLFGGYFHDNTVDHVSMDIEVSLDSGFSYNLAVDNAFVSTGTNPIKFGSGSFQFAANGIDSNIFRIVGQGGTVGFATSENAILSGFVIEPITELGDFNGFGGVTTDDFFVLSNNLGNRSGVTWIGHAGGDINLDGVVDMDDFGQFKALFPQVVNAALGIPEPSTIGLAVLACVSALLVTYRNGGLR